MWIFKFVPPDFWELSLVFELHHSLNSYNSHLKSCIICSKQNYFNGICNSLCIYLLKILVFAFFPRSLKKWELLRSGVLTYHQHVRCQNRTTLLLLWLDVDQHQSAVLPSSVGLDMIKSSSLKSRTTPVAWGT